MPITVQHGPGERSNAGQILAQSGLANLAREQQGKLEADRLAQQRSLEANRLRQQRDMQLTQIDAQASQQREAAEMGMARDAMRFGLDQQLREDEYVREIEINKQKAKQEAEQFDYIYTAKQRQEVAQLNDSLRRIDESDEFNDTQRSQAKRAVILRMGGVNPTAVPADPNKMKLPEGRSLQETWKDEDGNIMAYSAKGEPIIRQDYKDTKPGIQAQQDYNRQEAEDKWIADLSTEMVDDGEGGKRPMLSGEIAKIIFTAESVREELEKKRVEKQQQQELIESGAPDWVQQRISEGVDIQLVDIDLGPVMGPIHAIARQLANKPDRTPSEEADLQALILRLREYSPESGIEEFAVQERQGLKKKSRSRFSGSNTGMTYGVF